MEEFMNADGPEREPAVDAENLSQLQIEQRALAIKEEELLIKQSELSLKESELEIKQGEFELKQRDSLKQRFTAVSVAVIAALASLVGVAATAAVQWRGQVQVATLDATNAKARAGALEREIVARAEAAEKATREARELASRDFEYGLVRDATNASDPFVVRDRLRMLLSYDLLVLLKDKVLLRMHQDPKGGTDAAQVEVVNGKPGRTNDLIKAYERRLDVQKGDVDAMILLGFALYKVDRTSEALQWLEKALTILPNSPWGLYNAALVSCRTKDFEKADVYLERLLRNDEKFAGIIKRSGQFEHCKGFSKQLAKVW